MRPRESNPVEIETKLFDENNILDTMTIAREYNRTIERSYSFTNTFSITRT